MPSTSTIRVLRPGRAAAQASAAETVVLPTPPLPATMTRREAAKNCAGSNLDPLAVGRFGGTLLRRLSTVGAGLTALAVLFGAVLGGVGRGTRPSLGRESPAAASDGSDAGPGRASSRSAACSTRSPVDFVERSIDDAERCGRGRHRAAAEQRRRRRPATPHRRAGSSRSHDSPVPVAVVGRSLAAPARSARPPSWPAWPTEVGIAPGSRIGRTGDLVVPQTCFDRRSPRPLGRLEPARVGADEALRTEGRRPSRRPRSATSSSALPGVKTKVVRQGGRPRRQTVPIAGVQLAARSRTSCCTPWPARPSAYLLFVIGMALIVFELFTAGVGVAGLVGAGLLRARLLRPRRPARRIRSASRCLVLAMVGFAIDVQTGVPRVLDRIGAACADRVGSLLLYDGFSLSWITLLVGIGGISLFMLAGMPAMVRTRFSTPTIGREWMIGEIGEAVADGQSRRRRPDQGAPVAGPTNRATPIRPARPSGWSRSRACARGRARGRWGARLPGARARPNRRRHWPCRRPLLGVPVAM